MNNIKLPNKTYLRIDQMYAFIAEDEGGEGIMGFRGPDGIMMPMVGADMERVQSLIPIAEQIKKLTGKPYKIYRFNNREIIK